MSYFSELDREEFALWIEVNRAEKGVSTGDYRITNYKLNDKMVRAMLERDRRIALKKWRRKYEDKRNAEKSCNSKNNEQM